MTQQIQKRLRINLTKEAQRLKHENSKTLNKETEEDTRRRFNHL